MKPEQLQTHLAAVTRDKLGRFVEIERLRECKTGSCDLSEQDDLGEAVLEFDAFLETLEDLALDTDPKSARANAQLLRDYRQYLREDQAILFREQDRQEAARMRQAANLDDSSGPAFIDTSEVDAVDLTGLEGADARRLSVVLLQWNEGKMYQWRGGKRYLHRNVKTIDLNHPVIIELGLSDDLWPVVREQGLNVSRENLYQIRRGVALPRAA